MNGDRIAVARAEITRRRQLAQAVEHFTSPWAMFPGDDQNDHAVGYDTERPDAGLICTTPDYGQLCLPDFIAANDPAHVLAVLAAAELILDRHNLADWYELDDPDAPRLCACCTYDDRQVPWPCRDALAVLDVYAPYERCPRPECRNPALAGQTCAAHQLTETR